MSELDHPEYNGDSAKNPLPTPAAALESPQAAKLGRKKLYVALLLFSILVIVIIVVLALVVKIVISSSTSSFPSSKSTTTTHTTTSIQPTSTLTTINTASTSSTSIYTTSTTSISSTSTSSTSTSSTSTTTTMILGIPSLAATNSPMIGVGQYEVFTANMPQLQQGVPTYDYNYQIINSITKALVANQLYVGVSSATNVFSWQVPDRDAGNTIEANVTITDSELPAATVNSIYIAAITISLQQQTTVTTISTTTTGTTSSTSISSTSSSTTSTSTSSMTTIVSSSFSCSGTDPNVAIPSGPHGLYVFLGAAYSIYNAPAGTLNAPEANYLIYNNPVVCGALLDFDWNALEPQNGIYNWNTINQNISIWAAGGKKIGITIEATSTSSGEYTPTWVLNAGNSLSLSQCNEGNHQNAPIPAYWQPAFYVPYQLFIANVIKEYGNNPNVEYIRIGLGRGAETLPFGSAGAQCKAYAAGIGYSLKNYTSYVINTLNYEGTLGAAQKMMVVPDSINAGNLTFVDEVTSNAVKDGILIGNDGLDQIDIANYDSGQQCGTNNWCSIFNEYKGETTLSSETLAVSNPSNNPGAGTGTLTDLVPFTMQRGTQIMDLFWQDYLTAYDPNYPNYTQYHSIYANTFQIAANVIG